LRPTLRILGHYRRRKRQYGQQSNDYRGHRTSHFTCPPFLRGKLIMAALPATNRESADAHNARGGMFAGLCLLDVFYWNSYRTLATTPYLPSLSFE
jgi:hypothetical protein